MATVVVFLAAMLQSGGVAPEWDVRVQAEKLSKDIGALRAMVSQLEPDRWMIVGAPESMARRRRQALAEMSAVEQAGQTVAAQPERFAPALELLQHLDTALLETHWLIHAVRKYQNPAMADVMESALEPYENARIGLRNYVQDLSASREKEMEVAEKEAQRCREMLSRPAPRPVRPGGA